MKGYLLTIARNLYLQRRRRAARQAEVSGDRAAMRLLRRTKSLINLRSWLMGLPLFLTVLPLSVHHDGEELHWTFLGDPRAVGLSLVLATASWLGYFAIDRRLRGTAM